jgi:SSS family solute:Na+ symporter
MPLYMLMFPFLVIAAYYALLTIPGLKVPDYALLAVSVSLLPSWLVGLMAGGAALTGILVMAVTALTVGGLFSKNILGVINPDMKQTQMVRWTQVATAIFLIGGVILALYYPTLMASVVTVAYSGLTQTFVGMMFAFLWKRSTKWGVGAGLLVGTVTLFLLKTVPYGLNKGLIALLINLLVAVVVSLMTTPDQETVNRFEAYIAKSKGPVAAKAGATPLQVV